MQGEAKERWMLLCEQASTEQNPEKLLELMREINNLLEAKRTRIIELKEQEPHAEKPL